MRRIAIGFLLYAFAISALVPASSAQTGSAERLRIVYGAVRSALALISTERETGSGFIIASTDRLTYLLTANHVISGAKSIEIYLNNEPDVIHKGHLVKSDAQHDIALLTIARGHLSPLGIAASADEGTPVATAGYPRMSIAFWKRQGELKESLGAGVIKSVRFGGETVEHSAATDSGQSGGPLFDEASGIIYGVVLGKYQGVEATYVAAGFRRIREFVGTTIALGDSTATVAAALATASPALSPSPSPAPTENAKPTPAPSPTPESLSKAELSNILSLSYFTYEFGNGTGQTYGRDQQAQIAGCSVQIKIHRRWDNSDLSFEVPLGDVRDVKAYEARGYWAQQSVEFISRIGHDFHISGGSARELRFGVRGLNSDLSAIVFSFRRWVTDCSPR